MAKRKTTMPADLKSKCAAVIHTATTAAAAAGVIPIPMADTIPITAAQVTMIIGLGRVFDISLSEAAAKSILGGTMASQTGRAIFSGIIKGIPGVGTVVGGAISAGTSIALTETLGWIVAEDFYKKSLDPDAESILDTADTVINGFGNFAGSVNSSARASTVSASTVSTKAKKKRFGVF